MGAMTATDPRASQGADDGAQRDARGEAGAPSIWDRAAVSFARWRRGDPRAMDELVRVMTPVLWHVVRAYGLDRMLAEDVVQATWLTLVRRHESIHDPHAIGGWLTMCARREAWRAGRAQQRVRPTDTVHLEPMLEADASAEQRVHQSERDRRLWSAVESLDARCRRLLRIVAFDDRPDYAHIARDLQMPIGSIGPTRGRCLGKLRAALAADGWRGDTHDL